MCAFIFLFLNYKQNNEKNSNYDQYDQSTGYESHGDAIRQANNGDERIGRRGPHNLLLDLPDVFSLEDARRVRRQQGLPDKGLRPMISNWKSRGYINQISEISFEKLRFKSGE